MAGRAGAPPPTTAKNTPCRTRPNDDSEDGAGRFDSTRGPGGRPLTGHYRTDAASGPARRMVLPGQAADNDRPQGPTRCARSSAG